jgi:hypothetical protein
MLDQVLGDLSGILFELLGQGHSTVELVVTELRFTRLGDPGVPQRDSRRFGRLGYQSIELLLDLHRFVSVRVKSFDGVSTRTGGE